jgi:hypothetical protein
MARAPFMLDTYGYKYTHSICVILIAFPLQQWLCASASILRFTYVTCLVNLLVGFPKAIEEALCPV